MKDQRTKARVYLVSELKLVLEDAKRHIAVEK
jgi:hypothetical protein